MKTALLIFLIAFHLTQYACASGAPTVNITTTDEGVSFRLQDINYRTETKAKTLDEVETWLREIFADKVQGNTVLIFADHPTSFKTVFDVLRSVKAAGVEQYSITAVEPRDDVATHVIGKSDKIRFTR